MNVFEVFIYQSFLNYNLHCQLSFIAAETGKLCSFLITLFRKYLTIVVGKPASCQLTGHGVDGVTTLSLGRQRAIGGLGQLFQSPTNHGLPLRRRVASLSRSHAARAGHGWRAGHSSALDV